ncbi:hypothetical protein ADK55_23470, partial [Streptomyces sp. WM4235]
MALLATAGAHRLAEAILGRHKLRLGLVGAGVVPDRTPRGGWGPDWVEAFRGVRADVEGLVRAEL